MSFQQQSGLQGVAVCRSWPLRALLDRVGSGMEAAAWSAYLPVGLLPPELHNGGEIAKAGSTPGSSTADFQQNPETAVSENSFGLGLDGVALTGRVWSLSQEAHGCRQVQAALAAATQDESREALASELRGHVVQACKCPHANHVLQKVIALLQPEALQFVIEELQFSSGAICQIARHKYGCRIIQQLVEHCHAYQVRRLVLSLLPQVGVLSRHPYGNYVVQNLLQHSTDEQRQQMVRSLATEIRQLGSEACGCAVLSTALTYAPHKDRQELARSLLEEPGLLASMARTRYGHVAVVRTLDLLDGSEHAQANQRLRSEMRALQVSRYGRLVLRHLESLEPGVLSVASRAGA